MALFSILNVSELKPEQRRAAETLLGRPLESDEVIVMNVSKVGREEEEAAIRQGIREKLDRGIEQLARGEGLDGEQVFSGLDAELSEMEKSSRTG